ncbi:MAG: RNA-guided endonuclease InsQ/TnpB family protein, partial [Candidatus Hodarchaeota archaeon]
MLLAQKIRIFPTQEQSNVLWDLSEKCRLLYNFGLKERIDNWRENRDKPKEARHNITYKEQQNNLPSLKKKYPKYNWVFSKVLQMTLRKLDSAYKSFFIKWNNGDKTAHPPKFKGKKYFTTLCYNQSGFKLAKKKTHVQFSHNHPSKEPLIFRFMSPYRGTEKIKQIEITHFSNKWFICIIYEFTPVNYTDNGLYQAIDLGISNLVSAVNLHLKFIQIKNRRADLYWKKKVNEVQSKRDHCKKYSHRWHKYNEKLSKMKRRCANQMRDYQHKISKKIVSNTKANTIIIGDLSVKKMAK